MKIEVTLRLYKGGFDRTSYIYIYIYIYMCVCVCVYIYICIYIYTYMSVIFDRTVSDFKIEVAS